MSANDIFQGSDNIVVLGQAGSGKTTLLMDLVNMSPENYITLSSIALAAYACGGQTIHSMFKIPPSDEAICDLDEFAASLDIRAFKSWPGTVKGLIFDEISAVQSKLFCLVDLICRIIFANSASFGGLRIFAFGDFYQLPPVISQSIGLFTYEGKNMMNGYAFDTELWTRLKFKLIHLDSNRRQSQDEGLFKCLMHCRTGRLSNEDVLLLYSRICSCNYFSWAKLSPTYVFGKNLIVNKIHDCEYEKNGNPERVYIAKAHKNGQVNIPNTMVVPVKLRLKVGTLVMVRKNIPQENISNGSRGIVFSLDKETVMVELSNGRKVCITPVVFDVPYGAGIIKVSQLPLCHAYAVYHS